MLAESLLVEVTDTRNRPVAGATVVFSFTDATSGGVANPASATTNSDGLAFSRLRLGSQVGEVTGTVAVPVDPGVTPVEAPFTATAVPDNANGIAPVSGNDQSAPVGTALPAPLVVKVTDAFGNPIAGFTVTWSAEGGGSVSETSTVTGTDGQTSVTRTLGPTAGQQTTLATAEGLAAGSPVTFTHTAIAGAAERIVKVSGDGQNGSSGTELPLPLVVQVFDAQNNPIPNRAVTWVPGAGDGTVNPETSTTDGQGSTSTRWTLGAAGSNTVNAVVSGVGTATFTATAAAGGVSASRSRVEVSPSSIPANGTSTSTITVRVRDGSNTRLSGVSVSATSSGSGNEISPPSATTDEDGVARFTFRSTVGERKTITVVAGGVTLDDRRVINVLALETTTEITDVQPEPSTSGQSITVTFSVTGEGGGTPTGTVTIFSFNEQDVGCTVPVSQGSCAFVLNTVTTHSLGATYSGDSQFEDSSDPDGRDHVVLPATPTNQAPVAGNDAYTTPGAGEALSVPAPGVLANDTDPDSPALSAQNASDPPQGSVSLNSDGAFIYTPDLGATGSDSFTYEASDGSLTSTATVTITIAP
jgi:adhesin/invasin